VIAKCRRTCFVVPFRSTSPAPSFLLSCLPALVIALVAPTARAQLPPAPPAVASSAPDGVDRVPLRLALATAGAWGVAPGTFYNQLLGARLDFVFSPRVSLGGALDYANLKGKDGRASSALVTAQLEYRAGDPASSVRVPLRFASGYLGGNGPVVKAAAGLAFRLTPTVDLVTELFAPTVWLTNNQSLLSFNFSLELNIKL
jgi:hypothetical protein